MRQHTLARRTLWRIAAAVVGCLLGMATVACWAQRDELSVPNPGFEEIGGTVAPEFLRDAAITDRVPAGWVAMQWAPFGSKFETIVEDGAGRAGSRACAARNLDATACPGIYTRISLPPGRYELTFYVRCQAGKRGFVRAYLGDAYSPLELVGPGWRRVTYERTIRSALSDAEIRLQNHSRRVTTVWFDDVSLRRVAPRSVSFVPDKRRRPPKTLLLSPLAPADLQRDAAAWAERGFGGFLLRDIMTDWSVDVWSADGDPVTTGEDDEKLQEVLACNAACRAHEIDNFIYVPWTTPIPLWLDDEGWEDAIDALHQAAIFAARSQCKGVAIDVASIAEQFWPQWEGYDYSLYSKSALRQAAYARGTQIATAIFGAQPELELLLLPEGLLEYGPFYEYLFRGIMEQAGEARYRGGVHLLSKGTFDVTNVEDLLQYPSSIDLAVRTLVNKAAQRYWQKRCSLALGSWPLGYTRPITDADGGLAGWGGRPQIFGDEQIGKYGDRGPRFPIERFSEQFAGMMMAGKKYVWVYAHGPTWWRGEPMPDTAGMTPQEIAKLRARHTVENIDEYYVIVRRHDVVKLRK